MEVTNFYNYGTMIQVEPGATQIINNYGSTAQEPSEAVALPRLLESVESVRSYFWGDSSMAVIFCVCRDCFGYSDNMSQFEREFNCAEGLLSNTFRNNPYMRMPIDKWRENGAKERVLRLVDVFKNAVNGNIAQ